MLCKSLMYNNKNMNVCWLILGVICEYLESHENTCSHTSVSTCMEVYRPYTCKCTYIYMCILLHVQLQKYRHTVFSASNLFASQCSLHHLSVWPRMCILSTTICTAASILVCSVRSHRTGFCEYLRRWQASS